MAETLADHTQDEALREELAQYRLEKAAEEKQRRRAELLAEHAVREAQD